MSMLRSRLERLTPALTAKERILALLRARATGLEPDPEIRRTLPDDQRREFDRYAGLLYTANVQLGALAHVTAIRAEHLEWDYGNLVRLEQGPTPMEDES